MEQAVIYHQEYGARNVVAFEDRMAMLVDIPEAVVSCDRHRAIEMHAGLMKAPDLTQRYDLPV